jgi:hypothetical protein
LLGIAVTAGCGGGNSSGSGGMGGIAADGAAGAGGSASGGAGGPGGGGVAGSGGSGTGGATGGSGGAAGGTGGVPNLAMCGTSGNTCTKADTDSYNTCLVTKCESAYVPCIGPNWKSGDYAGACGTWFKCVNACKCGDLNCYLACGGAPEACTTCLQTASACQKQMCPRPACFDTAPDGGLPNFGDAGLPIFGDGGITFPGIDGGGMACDDLKKCCDSMTNAEQKMSCLQAWESFKALPDFYCAGTLSGYRAGGLCQ